jgi:glycosyltransferase involved in cell wall biosynthesis
MSRGGSTDVVVYAPGLASGGGAEKTALVLAAALADVGLTVTCFTDVAITHEQLRDHFGLELRSVTLRVLPSPRLPARIPRAVADIVRDAAQVRAMRAARPRLFVNMRFKSQLPGVGAQNWYYVHFPQRSEIMVRTRVHATYLRLVSGIRRAVVQRGARRFQDTYQVVLANSEYTRSHVLDRWGVDAITLYPPCAQASGLPAAERTRTILSVGRFQARTPNAPYKAQEVLIDTFARLPDLRRDGWSLHLVGAVGGSDADRAYFDSICSLAEGLDVHVHPNASHELLRSLSDRARLYWHAQGFGTDERLHPEAQEHFGISTVEAMASGIVPLVYGTAGPAEVVQDEPELTWTTQEDLVAKTRAHVAAGRWEHWQERGTRRAAEFSEGAFAEHVVTLYETRVDPSIARRRTG